MMCAWDELWCALAVLANLNRNHGELRSRAARLHLDHPVILFGTRDDLDLSGSRAFLAHRLAGLALESEVAIASDDRAELAQFALVELGDRLRGILALVLGRLHVHADERRADLDVCATRLVLVALQERRAGINRQAGLDAL